MRQGSTTGSLSSRRNQTRTIIPTASSSASSSTRPAPPAVKKNQSNYQHIDNDSGFRNWWTSIDIAADREGVENVLDPDHTPSTTDEINLHTANCGHILNIFSLKGKTGPIQNIVTEVKESEVPFGGQVAAEKIVAYYKSSDISAIRAQKHRDKIDSLHIPANHSGTIEKLLLEWEKWVSEYNTLVSTNDKYTDNMKLS